jgi:transposase-like protein
LAHANAPLTPEGRRRLVMRVLQDRRPISHVADEGGVSRQRLTVWVNRYKLLGDEGLVDRSSRPARSPNTTAIELEDRIEAMRRVRKWGPDRIAGPVEPGPVG